MMRLDAQQVRQQISNLLLAYPELAEDEVLRADTIEGATDAHELLREAERLRREATTLAAGIASTMAELEERQKRFERREKAMRTLELSIMQAADLHKVVLPEATLSLQKGRERLEIPDDAAVPDEFCRIVKSPDKTKIKDAMQQGWQPNWAVTITGEQTLSVRVR